MMKILSLTAGAVLVMFCVPAYSMEVSAGQGHLKSQGFEAEVTGDITQLTVLVQSLTDKVKLLNDELDDIQTCVKQGKIYKANKCQNDPVVAALANCTKKGQGYDIQKDKCVDMPSPFEKNSILGAYSLTCPSGWSRFDRANGRFLVGNANIYSIGEIGGENKVALTVGEMPAHKHKVSDKYHTGAGGGNYGLKNGGSAEVATRDTTEVGGGKAHENRPPYVVVTWCIKD